jgi:GT2 family glycosyltransferase
VVVDNASPDDTCKVVRDWASGAAPFVRPQASPLPPQPPVAKPIPLTEIDTPQIGAQLGPLTLLHSDINTGFAGGVNLGLRALMGQVDWYWVLNPDCVTPPETARFYAERAAAAGDFALIACTTAYYAHPDRIQSAGGWVNRRTGVCNQRAFNAPLSALSQLSGELDWVSGANLIASPLFLERVGLMREDYFLYYEEVDWAFRRGDLPLIFLPEALVYHHGGTVIGSGSIGRRPSPFSNYFTHRNRIRFARRFLSRTPIWAALYGLAKAAQLILYGALDEAYAVVAGMFGLPAPSSVRKRFADPQTAALALGRVKV